MRDIFDKHPKESRWLLAVPLAVVLGVLLLEFETSGIRVSPSLLTIALAIFSILLPPRAVLFWAVVLFFPVVLTLLYIPNNGVRETLPFVALRSAAYFAVACVAVGLSRYRWNSERRFEGLLDVFDALKTPVVVSDVDGNVNFVNRACCELLGRDAAELKGTSFFSIFTQPDQRGQSIERYLKFFDKASGQNSSMVVSIQNGAGEMLRTANCFAMEWDKHKLLVTQLS
ncbi:MAG: PAS domain-containing protein [Spartobacteria bacterium]